MIYELSRYIRRLGVPFVTVFFGFSSIAAGQNATLQGRILDATTGQPLVNATVASTSAGLSVKTDSVGRFVLGGLKVGIHKFLVSRDGYARGGITLAFAAREVMERDFSLDPIGTPLAPTADSAKGAQRLAKVDVTADPALGRRYADFERRRQTGRGQYITRDDLEKGNYGSLQDAMRMLRGIKFSCAGSFCSAQMTRAPMGCFPDYVVDERVDNAFGPTIPVRDIQGVEVYTGASDVPGEFAGANAGCGVVVIWTTSGRAPRRK
jgi:hypothetical protein